MSSEAFSGHFDVFAGSWRDPTKQSSKMVEDGTQGLTADQIAPRNSHGELLVEALASYEHLSTPPITCVCASQT